MGSRRRRHTNNKEYRQCKSGHTEHFLRRIARQLGVPFVLPCPKSVGCASEDTRLDGRTPDGRFEDRSEGYL